MSFKLIAIRPLEGCNPKFLKVLKENEFYTFYSDFVFEKSLNENEIKLKYKSTLPEELFWDDKKCHINVSAVVGKNGSGKSSILELFYVAIYNFSVIKGIIKADEILENIEFDFEELNDIVKSSNMDDVNNNIRILNDYKYYLENKNNEKEIIEIENNINVQIFFTIGSEIYVINLKKTTATIHKLNKDEEGDYIQFYCIINENNNDEFKSLKQNWGLFYSIVNNYSLYGLNSNEIGDWINKIFHKNDSYQTPIVINPMRIDGNIDVNTETDLSKSRLLSNILTYVRENEKIEDSFRCLVKNKIASDLILKLKLDKFKNKKGEVEFDYLEKYKELYLLDILNVFKIHSDELDITKNEFDKKYGDEKLNLAEKYAIEYVFRKIQKIANVYEIEKKRFRSKESKFDFESKLLVREFLELLKNEDSHITFKLRQAINFLKYDYKSFLKTRNYEEEVIIPIESLSKEIFENLQNLQKKYLKPIKDSNDKEWFFIPKNFNLINFIPPSFFEIDIDFENNMGKFSFLSSGEKQKIFSISSILYHIMNINSNHTDNISGKYEYRYVNIMFDEIELCFHPEMQKSFINDLLKSLQRIDHMNIYMNIVFVTHSPFILSDIPNQNIMYLDKGNCLFGNKRPQNSFGANITDLLADSFFFGNGDKALIGDFAREKIKQVIKWLNNEESKILNKEEAKMIIEIIDEPLLKYKLLEMYFDIFPEQYDLEKEKEDVRKRAIELGIIKERND
ncbi:hypothetical protein [Flavobacterium soyangense]|uniref:ATPase AAA-type core domain-containing protein n=1 Tax=Flavobacterium soyangense TaxID=2023265 RepID=A0A930UC32_9FLAO|nr:hypothetical protein [Flavobacterium soyangense]MBF2708566.1 hypothetical protein [Flavobacterium soyangense]